MPLSRLSGAGWQGVGSRGEAAQGGARQGMGRSAGANQAIHALVAWNLAYVCKAGDAGEGAPTCLDNPRPPKCYVIT